MAETVPLTTKKYVYTRFCKIIDNQMTTPTYTAEIYIFFKISHEVSLYFMNI